MKKIFKSINNIKYSLLVWGDPFHSNGSDIILCLPGNPGICEFYTEFAKEIYKQTSLPICVLNYIGHEDIKDRKLGILKKQEHLFNLEDQLKQKLDFINNHLSENNKIHLIGHSIGAWMLVELIDKNDNIINRISSVNLLFPTLQRMAESSNGRFLNNIVRKIYMLPVILCSFLQWLPEQLSVWLINIYLMCTSLPSCLADRFQKVINAYVLKNVFYLAFNEMDTVVKLNEGGIEKIKHVTNVIYGQHDKWAPIEFMEDLNKYNPDLGMTKVNIEHDFVLKSSEEVATMVAEFINKKRL